MKILSLGFSLGFLMLAGCSSPMKTILVQREALNATLDVLAARAEQGKLTDEEIDRVVVYAQAADRLLYKAEAVVKIGGDWKALMDEFRDVLADLTAYELRIQDQRSFP